VVRHLAIEAEPTKQAVRKVQVHLPAVANQQHPDEQFGIDRRPASAAMAADGCRSPKRSIDLNK